MTKKRRLSEMVIVMGSQSLRTKDHGWSKLKKAGGWGFDIAHLKSCATSFSVTLAFCAPKQLGKVKQT